MGDEPVRRNPLGHPEPRQRPRPIGQGPLRHRNAVEVGRGPRRGDLTLGGGHGIPKSPGDNLAGTVDDLVADPDEQVRLVDRRGDEDSAALQRRAPTDLGLAHDGIVERMARGEQVRPHIAATAAARARYAVDLESDALIP